MAQADPRIHVLHRSSKEGLGRAYLAGFAWALERDYASVFEMDADFSHDPKYLPRFLEAIEAADLVLGSRYEGGVNVVNWPMSRLLLSWFANKYVRWFTGLPLTDATGGFKCFRREALQALPFDRVRSNGYAFQIEMLLPGLAQRLPAQGNPDRLCRPGGRAEQDERAHRARGDLDGAVAPPPGTVREARVTVVFWKMTGSGNDFVMLDGRTTTPAEWPAERIARLCDRRDGVGADGLVFLTPAGPNAVRMTFFNSDGSHADMCGNAALCSARLAARLELADPAGMTLVTDAGAFPVRCVGPGNLAELHLPDIELPKALAIPLVDGEQSIHLAVVGVPHLIAFVDQVGEVDLDRRGRELRFHSACGPGGANANFVSRVSGSTGTSAEAEPAWAIRTYERGVEGETFACGTGSVAAALAIAAGGLDRLPLRFRSSSGRVLSVSATIVDGVGRDVWLCGEGRHVARGVWLDD